MRLGAQCPDLGRCFLQEDAVTFKIISTGWECRPFVERTLVSIESQTVSDYEVRIVVDPSEDGTEQFVKDWCDARDDRWTYEFTESKRFSMPN